MIEAPKTMEDYKQIFENHIDLCETLHNNAKLIPEKLMSKIEDIMYKHYEPS